MIEASEREKREPEKKTPRWGRVRSSKSDSTEVGRYNRNGNPNPNTLRQFTISTYSFLIIKPIFFSFSRLKVLNP